MAGQPLPGGMQSNGSCYDWTHFQGEMLVGTCDNFGGYLPTKGCDGLKRGGGCAYCGRGQRDPKENKVQ